MTHFGHLCFPLCRIPITPWVKNTIFSYAKGERNSFFAWKNERTGSY